MKISKNVLHYIFFAGITVIFIIVTYLYFNFAGNREKIMKVVLSNITSNEPGCRFNLQDEKKFNYYEIELNGMQAGYILTDKINKSTFIPEKYYLITPEFELNNCFEFKHSIGDVLKCDTQNINEIQGKDTEFFLEFIEYIKTISNPSEKKSGVYTGSSEGVKGLIKVKVTIDGNKITKIDIIESADGSYPAGKTALKIIPERIIEKQSFEIDAVSGATVTCKGIIEAVKNSLTKKNEN
ncbi:FMN-binding protein [Candidatus Dependentiae bacterium]|nr:FMN-binding protein [Candidatus Dependentiae bacterium]